MKRSKLSMCCCLAVSVVCLSGYTAGQESPAPVEKSARDQVVELYEKAKAAGEQVPKDVYEWTVQDLGKVGDWEYRVVEMSLGDSEALEKQLNELGAERWECIWIQQSGDKTSFIFKRPVKSYLRHVPLSQLMKLVPGGGSGDSGE